MVTYRRPFLFSSILPSGRISHYLCMYRIIYPFIVLFGSKSENGTSPERGQRVYVKASKWEESIRNLSYCRGGVEKQSTLQRMSRIATRRFSRQTTNEAAHGELRPWKSKLCQVRMPSALIELTARWKIAF